MRIYKDSWLTTRPIAHRGLWGGNIIENSLTAYQNAVNNGYPIEIDLYRSKDGVLMSFHDATLNRMTGADGFIYDKTFFELEREYARLPKEFLGYRKNERAAVGGNRHGVIRISDFLLAKTGSKTAELSLMDWFFVPEQALLEATSGKIFCDSNNVLTDKLKKLSYMPEDVRLKKLAGNLLMMAQAGQYNYKRTLKRGDTAAAQLSVIEFVKATLNVVFLLNKRYIPYYKWVFRALRELKTLPSLEKTLEYLISSENATNSDKKQALIEEVCGAIANELRNQDLVSIDSSDMETLAYMVNDKITDNNIRNLHILYAL